jgi:hypothetical protein
MSINSSFALQRAGERATFDHGWLHTSHSFSFAEYHDRVTLTGERCASLTTIA